MLIDREDEGRDDRSADDTEPIDLAGLEVQIESLTRRIIGAGAGNGIFILLVVQAEKTSGRGRVGVRVSIGVRGTEVVLELPRRAPVLIGQKDDALLVVVERERPQPIFNDERAVQPICSHRVEVGVPESRSRRVGDEIVCHLLPRGNGALVLGGKPVRIGRSTLMDSMPMNLGSGTI